MLPGNIQIVTKAAALHYSNSGTWVRNSGAKVCLDVWLQLVCCAYLLSSVQVFRTGSGSCKLTSNVGNLELGVLGRVRSGWVASTKITRTGVVQSDGGERELRIVE